MDIRQLTPDYYVEKFFDFKTPSDHRTINLLTLYGQVWALVLIYVGIATLYLIWLPKFKKTVGTYKPMEAFIAIYNGFMFGCFGTAMGISYWTTNGFSTFYNCETSDMNSVDPKSSMTVLMAIAFHLVKLLRSLEPMMYQIAGKKPPFSGIMVIENAFIHVSILIGIRFVFADFLVYAGVVDMVPMLLYYAHQTLQCGGFIPDHYQTWKHWNIAFQIIGRYYIYKHSCWASENPACQNDIIRPLIKLEYCTAVTSLVFHVVDLFVNGQKEYIDEEDEDLKQS